MRVSWRFHNYTATIYAYCIRNTLTPLLALRIVNPPCSNPTYAEYQQRTTTYDDSDVSNAPSNEFILLSRPTYPRTSAPKCPVRVNTGLPNMGYTCVVEFDLAHK
jgi:hypothetical protein